MPANCIAGLMIKRKMLNWPRVGLVFLFFIPGLWQVYKAKPTIVFDLLWDGSALILFMGAVLAQQLRYVLLTSLCRKV